MQLDPAVYRHHLEAFDMSEDAKLACMQTVWAFLEGALDRQCGGSPEQILLGIRASQATLAADDPVDSKSAFNQTYNDAALGTPARKSRP